MALTSIAGGFGLGHQPGFGTLPTSLLWMPSTAVNLNMNQNTQTLPAEVGGDYFLRGSYKGSVMGSGDVSFVARPNTLGHLLLMLCGVDTITNPSAGVYQHTMTPFLAGSGMNLPWYTLYKDVAGLYTEQYLNSRLRSLKIDVPKSSIMTGSASFVAGTPSKVLSSSLGVKTFDSTPQFQSCIASVSLTQEGVGTNISSNSIKVEKFALNYENNLTSDEFSVGNFYLDDITLLQRTVTADMDFIIRDSALVDAVYANGQSAPGTWSPILYRGALSLTLTNPFNIPGTTTPYGITFTFPGLDFLMMPIALQGAEVIRGSLSTQVTLGPSGSDRFSAVLTNGIASY